MNSINFTEHQPSLSGQTTIKKCEHCRIINIELVERLRKCSGCNVVYYCSITCQYGDRKNHRPYCKGMNAFTP